MDYIFIIGPSAVGKTTLAKSLYEHYKSVYIEQNMVPEFSIPVDCVDEGIYEEKICFENTIAQIQYFHKLGYKNIIALDFDDLRTRELPIIFKHTKFITLKLFSSDSEQIKYQMQHRYENEDGLYTLDHVKAQNDWIMKRSLLPNEVQIDINGKNKTEVLNEAIKIIDNYEPLLDYEYELASKELFNSWVESNKLRR